MKTIITISIWILFLKGLLAVGLTLYNGVREIIDGGTFSMLTAAGCAVGSFAFILACVAIWIRDRVK